MRKFASAKALKIRRFKNFQSQNDFQEIDTNNNPCVMREF